MKSLRWYIVLAVSLLALSAASYLVQIILFHRTEDTFFYMLQDIAFVPIQVLLVSFILSRLLAEREKRAMLKKLNMLIGAFYSEVGTDLIKLCSKFSSDLSALSAHLKITPRWHANDFNNAVRALPSSNPMLNSRAGDLYALRTYLEGRRGFLLSLLANPNLLEHDAFTDLLWAVFHLLEELTARTTFEGLPETDYDHLSGDMKRAYTQLLSEWIIYMKHLKEDYPYLFSLAVRLNPMDADSSPIVR